MDKSPTWKFVLIFILFVFALFAGVVRLPRLGMDLQGGAELTYRIEPLPGQSVMGLRDDVVQVLQQRVDSKGTKEIHFMSGADKMSFVVEAPGATTEQIEDVKRLVENQGTLFFKIVKKSSTGKYGVYTEEEIKQVKDEYAAYVNALKRGDKDAKEPQYQYHPANLAKDKKTGEPSTVEGFILMNYEEGSETPTCMDGQKLNRAYTTIDDLAKPAVGFEFSAASSRQFGAMTEKYKNEYMAIVLDGAVRSAPVIRSRIEGRGIIEGDFSQAEINTLVTVLKSGSLKGKPILESELIVGPGLGHDSVVKGLRAIVIGLILVLLAIGIYYFKNGMIADLAVIMNLVFIFGMLQVLDATLTLPGMAGLILTVGIAVDANILILERIREEHESGKSIKQSIASGYSRAFWTIFDANLTTLITAYILYKVGTGPIRGFAVTLMLGIASSMFTALFVTKAVYQFLLPRGGLKSIKMLQLVSHPNINFIGVRKIFMFMSAIAIIAGITLFSTTEDKYGIDFTGGVRILLNLKEKMPIADFRGRVKELDIENIKSAEIMSVGTDKEGSYSFIIRIRREKEEEEAGFKLEREAMKEKIVAGFKGMLAPEGLTLIRDESRDEILRELAELDREKKIRVRMFLDKKEDASLTDVAAALEAGGYAGCDVNIRPGGAGTRSLTVTSGQLADFDNSAAETHRLKIEEILSSKFRVTEDGVSEHEELLSQQKVGLYIIVAPTVATKDKSVDEVREMVDATLAGAGFESCSIEANEKFNEEFSGFMRFRVTSASIDGLGSTNEEKYAKDMQKALQDNFQIAEPFGSISKIGARVARNLREKAFVSVFLALLAIVIYITFRFEFKFGLGAILALFHDVSIAIGAVVLLDMIPGIDLKINLTIVAAFLTIVGYSLNDTIVVYDRIRENLRQAKKEIARGNWDIDKYKSLINASINQTLSRTMLTSTTTLIAVIVIFASGVADIQGFALTMIVGILVGTYSSVFIASPVLVFFYGRELNRRKSDRLGQAGQRKKAGA